MKGRNMAFYNTRQAAKILGIRPDNLSRAVWLGRLDPPTKSPSGNYLWTEQDIERASWVLLHKAYTPQVGVGR
jgi:DNA-binding transcriptional MerR regulator